MKKHARYAKCPIIEITKKFKEDGKLIGVRKALFIKSEQRSSSANSKIGRASCRERV